MKTGRKLNSRGRRGAAMLETAILLPLFLIFWFGVIDWGITFFVQQHIAHRASAAARWAVVNDFDEAKVRNVFLYGNPNASGTGSVWFSLHAPKVEVAKFGTGAAHDERVRITVSEYQWFHFTPFFSGTFFGRPLTFSIPCESMKTGA